MFPNTGRVVPCACGRPSSADYVAGIGAALRAEFGEGTGAVKRIMRWTGVSDRTARSWLQGAGGPSGRHLVALAGRSDRVLKAILDLAGRPQVALALEIEAIESALSQAAASLEAARRPRRPH